MAKNKAIRIPKTTALFVHGLARILRDQLELRVTEHEHWTFEQVGEWEECTRPGNCTRHGLSVRGLDYYDIKFALPCYQYDINTYVGVGQARVSYRKAELRTIIEDVGPSGNSSHLYRVRVWVQIEGGEILKGEYVLHDDTGSTYPTDEPIPNYPPNRIAFWKEEEAELAHSS